VTLVRASTVTSDNDEVVCAFFDYMRRRWFQSLRSQHTDALVHLQPLRSLTSTRSWGKRAAESDNVSPAGRNVSALKYLPPTAVQQRLLLLAVISTEGPRSHSKLHPFHIADALVNSWQQAALHTA
jgi:hypothetical protein